MFLGIQSTARKFHKIARELAANLFAGLVDCVVLRLFPFRGLDLYLISVATF
jgi:hypothetical protein